MEKKRKVGVFGLQQTIANEELKTFQQAVKDISIEEEIEENKPKPKYLKRYGLMGKIVTVSAIYDRETVEEEDGVTRRVWNIKKTMPRAGWVIGYRHIYSGKYYDASPRYQGLMSCDADWDPPYLEVEETIPCIKVCWWPTQNEVLVPMNSFILGGEPYVNAPEWTEKDKKQLSEWSKDFPRDKKGRWKKCV